jgi:DNA-binding IclR family transcriptional regulator
MLAHADADLRDWALSGYDYKALTPNTVRTHEQLDAALERIRTTGLADDP